MEYRMLLMNRTNESSPRQLMPSMILRKRKSQDYRETKYQLTITAGTHDSTMSSLQGGKSVDHSQSNFGYFWKKLDGMRSQIQ